MTNCLEKYCVKACGIAERVYSSAKEIVSYAMKVGDDLAASVLGTNRLEYALAGNYYGGISEGRSGLDELLSPNVYYKDKSKKDKKRGKQKNSSTPDGKPKVIRTKTAIITIFPSGIKKVRSKRKGSRK